MSERKNGPPSIHEQVETPHVYETDIAFGYRMLIAAQQAKANLATNTPKDEARQALKEAVERTMDETIKSEDEGHPTGVPESTKNIEEAFGEITDDNKKRPLLRGWAYYVGEQALSEKGPNGENFHDILDIALQGIEKGELPPVSPLPFGSFAVIDNIIPKLKNTNLINYLKYKNDKDPTPIKITDKVSDEIVEHVMNNPTYPPDEKDIVTESLTKDKEARVAAGPTPEELLQQEADRVTKEYMAQYNQYQAQYYEKVAVVEGAQNAVKFIAQQMTARKGEEDDFGLESGPQSIEVKTIRALSPENLKTFSGVQRALGLLTAALEEGLPKAPEFKSVTTVLDFNLERAGWNEQERLKITRTINFIYYSTLYNTAARNCDKEYGQWKAQIDGYTKTTETASKDEFKLNDLMIIAAHEPFREIDGKKEYLLPHLRLITTFLNDPKVINDLQRYKWDEWQKPESWVEDFVIKKIKDGEWEYPGQIFKYGVKLKESDHVALIVEQVRLAFRFWQGAGFENGWKNTPVLKDKKGRYAPRFDLAPEDVIKDDKTGELRERKRGILQTLFGRQEPHPFRMGFFGSEVDDHLSSIRRPRQFIQGVKQQILPSLGTGRPETIDSINLSSEMVGNINKKGEIWMSYGEILQHILYQGYADTIVFSKDEVSHTKFDNRPDGKKYTMPVSPHPIMADLFGILHAKDSDIDAVRNLYKKAAQIDAGNGPLIALALKKKFPKDFYEFASGTITPLVAEFARDPGEEIGGRKALQAEVVVSEYLPAIAAYWVSLGRQGEADHRIYNEQIHALFSAMKRENLWFENNVNFIKTTATSVATGDEDRQLSQQGRNLRASIYDAMAIGYLIIKGEKILEGMSLGDYAKGMAKIALPKFK